MGQEGIGSGGGKVRGELGQEGIGSGGGKVRGELGQEGIGSGGGKARRAASVRDRVKKTGVGGVKVR